MADNELPQSGEQAQGITPLERAARAIADYLERRKETDVDSFFGDTFGFDDLRAAGIDATVDLVAVSRAVLEAMREPSPDMVDAGRDVGPDAPYGLNEVRERWTVMIDAALEEG